jgi:hypothetical protein
MEKARVRLACSEVLYWWLFVGSSVIVLLMDFKACNEMVLYTLQQTEFSCHLA